MEFCLRILRDTVYVQTRVVCELWGSSWSCVHVCSLRGVGLPNVWVQY